MGAGEMGLSGIAADIDPFAPPEKLLSENWLPEG